MLRRFVIVAGGVVLVVALWLVAREPSTTRTPGRLATPPESRTDSRTLPSPPMVLSPVKPDLAQRNPGTTEVLRLRVGHTVELVSRSRTDEPVQMPSRGVRIAQNRLIVEVLSDVGKELTRISILDPRNVRAEFFAPDGSVEETYALARDAETTVAFPHWPEARTLVVYQPSWNGSNFRLREVGRVVLP